MQDELPDYGDWSDQELADELAHLDKEIEHCQKTIVNLRKSVNSAIDSKEAIINIIKQRAQRRGWKKK